jgi:hypothetical protein
MPWSLRPRAPLWAAASIAAIALAAGCRSCERGSSDGAGEAGPAARTDAGADAAPPIDPDESPRAPLDASLAPPGAERYLPRRTSGTACVYRAYADGSREATPEVEMRYTLDAAGRPLTIEYTNAEAGRTTIERRTLDAAGRPTKAVVETRDPDAGPSVEQRRFSHDVSGRTVLVRTTTNREDEPFANALAYEFDAEGRVLAVDEDAEGEALETRCRYAGQWPSRIERASRGRTSVQDFTFDAEGRLLGYVISSAGEVRSRVVTARGDDGFADSPAPGDPDESVEVYEGNCAEIFFSPCSSALAPPAPDAPTR